jgi:ribosomal protein S18 acetylase RimI-like enzyme
MKYYNTEFNITEIKNGEHSLIAPFITEHWGSSMIVSKGKIFNSAELKGFICKENNNIVGLITYRIENNECEIVSLNSTVENRGLGTSLINKMINHSRKNNYQRIWVMTTNDNTKAIRFYQKRGFEWVGYYKDSIQKSKKSIKVTSCY